MVYERAVAGAPNPLTYALIEGATPQSQLEYLSVAYNGVCEKYDWLCGVLARFSEGFDLDRIYKVDLSIMLVAVYEILFTDGVPDTVAVNEALELAKTYSTEKSAAFINGVLASVIKRKKELIDESEID
jgi:N utilization substance protein B